MKRAVGAVLLSATLHMTTCVAWTDDNGEMWAGPLARAVMTPEQAERCKTPEANTLQLRLERAIAYAKRKGIPARIILLKGRRSGSSLGCAAIFNLEMRTKKTQAVAMADQYDRSAEIFSMMASFAQSDVTPWGFGVNVSDTRIRYGNGSVVKKETALDKNAGRGAGNRLAWFSEAAHYPSDGERDARTLMLATLNTIPQKVGTIVIVESTANGPDGFFPETWRGAEWPEDEDYWHRWEPPGAAKREDNLWLRVFAAWFEIERNAIPTTAAEAAHIMATLSKSERYGVNTYHWTPQQLKWRRNVVANNFQGDERTFDQEYPHSPDSAFITTGSVAFDRDSLNILRARADAAKDHWRYGVLHTSGVTAEEMLTGKTREMSVRFEPTPKEEAWFAMLEPPTDGLRYILPVDPASEREVTDGTGDLDRMSMLMLRAGYTKQTAKERVQVPPRLVARVMWEMMDTHPTADTTTMMAVAMSAFFGNPVIPVETNKGEWVIGAFRRAALNLYRTKTSPRDREQKVLSKYGWYTTEESRAVLVKALQNIIHGTAYEQDDGTTVRLPGIEIEDLFTVRELEHFTRDRRGKYAASAGHHDDDVLCLGMGLHLIEHATPYRLPVKRRR